LNCVGRRELGYNTGWGKIEAAMRGTKEKEGSHRRLTIEMKEVTMKDVCIS